MKEKCDHVYVVGLSMGGTLALDLAAKYSDISGIMLINAAIDMPDLRSFIEGDVPRFLDGIGSDIKKEGVKELAYEKSPVQSIKSFLTYLDEVQQRLDKVNCSALVFSSTEDHVVPPENSKYIYHHISSEDKDLAALENSYHVATLDNDQQRIIEHCIQFVNKLSKQAADRSL